MRKIRSDALWHKLTPEQQKKIEHWFLDENLSYRAVHQRMRSELGVSCALSILGPMYHHCRELRSQEREAVMDLLTELLVEPGCDLERVQPQALAVISGRLIHRALRQDDIKTVSSLGCVMAKSEGNVIAKQRMALNAKKLGLQGLVLALKTGAVSREEFVTELRGQKRDSDANVADNDPLCSTYVPPGSTSTGLVRHKP